MDGGKKTARICQSAPLGKMGRLGVFRSTPQANHYNTGGFWMNFGVFWWRQERLTMGCFGECDLGSVKLWHCAADLFRCGCDN